MRQHKYVQETYSDGMVHITVVIDAKDHTKVLERLDIDDLNRTEWIRLAVKEKLARDTK